MTVVAFDLGGKTGVAMCSSDGWITSEVWQLDYGDLGGRRSPIPMVRMWDKLHELKNHMTLDHVLFEETFARGDARYRLDSLQYAVTLFCCLNEINWSRVAISAWKLAVLGKATATKAEYLAFARNMWGEEIETDDEAAALCLLHYHQKRM